MSETQRRVALYTAFSAHRDGGSPAGLVFDADGLSGDQMQVIARQVGVPATGFVTASDDHSIDVRFFSPRTEYGMCGHGTIALLTAMVDSGRMTGATEPRAIAIRTGFKSGEATIRCRDDGRLDALLHLEVAPIAECPFDVTPILAALGAAHCSDPALSSSDFTHLLLPMSLADVEALSPDFEALSAACEAAQVDTVAPYATETVDADCHVHTRDFCPAVGTDEAAATGTTNRAVVGHVVGRDPTRFGSGTHTVSIEQGLEMERPSRVDVEFDTFEGAVTRVAVGGVATHLEDRLI